MQKFILDQSNLSQLVFDNKYEIDPKREFLSRCIDGRYENNVIPAKAGIQNKIDSRLRGNDNLPALAFPGADAGELALILATARNYGFTVYPEKVYKSLIEVIGGEKNFQTNLKNCEHIKQMSFTPADYQLTDEEINFVKEKSAQAVKKGAVQTILHGEHGEGAVVYIRGNYGINPQYILKLDNGVEINTQIFTYHISLVDKRHRTLVSVLLRNKAVKLPDGCDEEWLYNAISDTAEIHTLETAKRLAKGLPIFEVEFDSDGMFKIKEMGVV